MSLHIPDKGEQLLRYYGWYSNKSRGLRKAVLALSEAKKDKRSPSHMPPIEEDLTHYQKQCKSVWAKLIRKIYEVDPLICPQCKHPMRGSACIERSENIAFIEDDSSIQKILKCLGLWESRSHSPPPSSIYEEIVYVDESSTPVPA